MLQHIRRDSLGAQGAGLTAAGVVVFVIAVVVDVGLWGYTGLAAVIAILGAALVAPGVTMWAVARALPADVAAPVIR